MRDLAARSSGVRRGWVILNRHGSLWDETLYPTPAAALGKLKQVPGYHSGKFRITPARRSIDWKRADPA